MNLFKTIIILVILNISCSSAAETVTYYVNDALGSPIAAMNQTGTVIWRESYDPYGNGRSNPSQNASDVGYTGHQKNDVTGLTYMQARNYDPIIGRFYSVDPVPFDNIYNFNKYSYGNNNPYKFIDPDGMKSDLWWTEPKKRHDDAVKKLAKKLERQGMKVRLEMRMLVTDEEGDTSIRIMDIVAEDKEGNISLIEVKTFASKKEGKLQKVAKKTAPGKAASVSSIGIRGAQWYLQMVNDATIARKGATLLRDGKKIGPTTVYWHGFQKTKNGFKTIPAFPITD